MHFQFIINYDISWKVKLFHMLKYYKNNSHSWSHCVQFIINSSFYFIMRCKYIFGLLWRFIIFSLDKMHRWIVHSKTRNVSLINRIHFDFMLTWNVAFTCINWVSKKGPCSQMSLSSRLQTPEELSELWVSHSHFSRKLSSFCKQQNSICLCRVSGSEIPVDVWLM